MLGYTVNTTLSLDVLSTLQTSGSMQVSEVNGIKFNYFPEKVATFVKNDTCICCGMKAHEVRLEEGNGGHAIFGSTHLNVWGKVDTVWGEFWDLMTVDHAILKSLNGPDVESNFNTMCRKCNQLRGSRYPNLQDFLDIYKPKAEQLIGTRASSLYHYRLRKREEASPEYQEIKAKRAAAKEAITSEYLRGLMASHVGAYNRHNKALKKALTEAQQ